MALLQGGMGPDGNIYPVMSDECHEALKNVLNDPGNTFFEDLEADGYDIVQFQAVFNGMQWSEWNSVWYDPTKSELWSDAVMAFDFFSADNEVDCAVVGMTIINSHQGVGSLP